jgi:hypothetical protein
MRQLRNLVVVLLFPAALGFFFTACSSTPPAPPTKYVSQFKGLLPQIMDNDSGLFHGILLGMKPEEVKHFSIKSDSLSLEDKETLIYEGKLEGAKEYTYECNFDEKGLHTVILEIHLKDEPNADSLLADFNRYFTLRYGPADESRGILSWNPSGGTRPARIELEEDPDYTYGKLTISFFDQSFDKAPQDGDSIVLP